MLQIRYAHHASAIGRVKILACSRKGKVIERVIRRARQRQIGYAAIEK